MRSRDSVVFTPVSLSPDTDDEETLVNAEVYINDLAQIRALVESSGMVSGSACPSCGMPFDKGKKRRLIDACGHERCYSCLFRSETCPLCARGHENIFEDDEYDLDDSFRDDNVSYDFPVDSRSLYSSPIPRLKFGKKHAFHSSSSQFSDAMDSVSLSGKALRTKPTSNSDPTGARHKGRAMAQSCPTPPTQRKRFFLNPKVLKSSFVAQRSAKREAQLASSENPSALSAWMTTSWEGKSRWPGVVLGKIKSLWSSSQGTANDGLNQLIGASTKVQDDEGDRVKHISSKSRKSSQLDLYMRLGLLLGNQRCNNDPTSVSGRVESVAPVEPIYARPPLRPKNSQNQDSFAASFSSLTSFETQTHASTNTSPISTLTGTSSEAEVAAAAAALRTPPKPRTKTKTKKGYPRDCESAASLVSSASASASTSMSISMSVSGLSNGSSSPLSPRRNSAANSGQVEEEQQLKRKTCFRRSNRTGNKTSGGDSKNRFAQLHATQLTLKPLFFEVPLLEAEPLFIGRQWLLHELESVIINGSSPGMLISGSPGTGKTALILEMVEHSCFGRRRGQLPATDQEITTGEREKVDPSNLQLSVRSTNEIVRKLASHVVAYHFCQADNNNTCLVPDLIHSLAAQLCQAPQLASYREYLLSEPHLQGYLSQRECTVDPDLALSRGIIEPLTSLRKAERLPEINMVILIDAVCEAEYHRPDRGDTIASFLARHAPNFPNWLKVVCTVRTQLQECTKQLPYTRICLDKCSNGATVAGHITKDLTDYISYRLAQNPVIQTNVTACVNGKTDSSHVATQTRFALHLLSLAKGSFLFVKLTLDLIESGHIIAKSASYKVLPVSMAQVYLLHFNLRFPTTASFEKVHAIFCVCLATLYPLTLTEIYYSVNSLYTDCIVSWEEFMQNFKMLSGFLVKRLDDTYMFFHPSFREWLMRRDEGESTKFLCDLRLGHAAVAFRLSRIEAPLEAEKGLELGHHVLKAHLYRGVTPNLPARDLQAIWISTSLQCVSSTLCTLRNIYSPNVKVSRLLLLAGASPNFKTEYMGNAPVLCMYAHEGSVEMVSLLLEFGADLELTNSQGCTALALAAARGHCDVVRRLAAAGASLGHADRAGQCPLVHAAKYGRLSVVGYLLACDWHSAETDDSEFTIDREEAAQQAVVAAASQGHESVVEYLLDMSEVTVDQPDTLIGETALTIAAANGSTATVSALLTRGANPLAVNAKGLSPLMLAAREGHWGTAERLLQVSLTMSTETELNQSAPLLEQRDPAGRTPLMLAASEGHTNLIELFLDRGSILEASDKEGLTALGWACLRGRIPAVQHLIERGADVKTTDNTGRTPLDLAAFQGNPKLVQLLLEKGAAIEHVDLHGMRPLDRAIGCRNILVVQCFLRRGAKLGPATWAMAAGKPDILLILLNKLLEDGNVLYRKGRLKEASHRYAYALKKFPEIPEQGSSDQNPDPSQNLILHSRSFAQLRLNFLLNLSRCKRKMNEFDEAIELADKALNLRADSYEAYYARAKARTDAGFLQEALEDINGAIRNAPVNNRQDRRVLVSLRDEIVSQIEGSGMGTSKAEFFRPSRFQTSVDTLTEL